MTRILGGSGAEKWIEQFGDAGGVHGIFDCRLSIADCRSLVLCSLWFGMTSLGSGAVWRPYPSPWVIDNPLIILYIQFVLKETICRY
jgi:hypothetical protein